MRDAFEDINGSHYDNYEQNAIDIVSFERDDEMFREYISVCSNQHNSIIDYANKTLMNYSRLLLEIEMQYALWEEFIKRLSFINMVTDSDSGKIFTSPN